MYVSESPFFSDQCLMELVKKDATVCCIMCTVLDITRKYDTFPYVQANAANSGDSNATKVIKIFLVSKSLNPLKKCI